MITTLDAPFPVATTESTITVEWLPVQTPSGMAMDKYEVQILGVDVIPDPTNVVVDRYCVYLCPSYVW